MTAELPADLVQGAARVIYACRPWTSKSRGTRMSCADCGTAVAATPSVLADRRRQVHAAGRSLAVVCDDCAVAEGAKTGAMVAMMPSRDEIEEANR